MIPTNTLVEHAHILEADAFKDEPRRFERVPCVVHDDPEDAACAVAQEVADLIRRKQSEGKQAVLGLATGSTPTGVYLHLIRLHKEEGLSCRNVVTFNLDEYYPMQPDRLQSYVCFMKTRLFDHIDIDPANTHIPDGTVPLEDLPAYCKNYEQMIEAAGGVDIQLLGIGHTGHIGFNEPGSSRTSRTRLITLSKVTRMDAASDFFGEQHVPMRAITMGIASILSARRVLLLAWGEGKAGVVSKAVEGPITSALPASFLQSHPNAQVVVDQAAAAELVRCKAPWLVQPCKWTDKHLVRKAVVWLSQAVGCPILKLNDDHYLEHGMGDLLTDMGPAEAINVMVFKELQSLITGWPAGRPQPGQVQPACQRILILSPHPDDDVISMGGTYGRLVHQGHEVHVAYQTSGSIAVHDADVLRMLDFAAGAPGVLAEGRDLAPAGANEHTGMQGTQGTYQQLQQQVSALPPGNPGDRPVLLLKGLVRRGEARAAARSVGQALNRLHFLDMPFYETGMVEKKPLSEHDISILVDLFNRIQPQHVYAAGDLSDPHGTHRVCFKAIQQALQRVAGQAWAQECKVFMYRGAWQEWGWHEADMAVPLSPAELDAKRRAIFCHQSQKDRPLFPGHDEREFWQRAEARNRATAKALDALGLAEYEGIELFKEYVFR